jgi:polyhydroxyalkanoate synthesis regulator protein
MREVRHFKKYANRKFYDEDRGEYVSVREIAAVVEGGGDVRMTCDRTGRDLTLEILARILYEEVRGAGRGAPLVNSGFAPGKSKLVGITPADLARLVRSFSRSA